MSKRFDIDMGYHKIYYESCDEFEKVREICLSEDNWLRKNYTSDNLQIEAHHGFVVVYHKITHEPMVMGGVFNDGRWPVNIARMLNRAYVFPNFRSRSQSELTEAFKFLHHHVIFPLIKANTFDSYFMTMQNRERPSKRWWEAWKKSMHDSSNGYWIEADGYVQSCPFNVQKCWQNFVYHDVVPGTFNLNTITENEWLLLPVGD